MVLTIEENEQLTRVGPGTVAGDLFRRYWLPIAGAAELEKEPIKKLRILGEDLVLFRDRRGKLGLLAEACMHRRTSLAYGIPEDDGIRCPYHGWLYATETGQCLEQPAEPEDSTFFQKIQTTAYPVQEESGLIFGYLGPAPAPLLPRFSIFSLDNAIKEVHSLNLPYNWLQRMENHFDSLHTAWLHGYYFRYVLDKMGDDPRRVKRPLIKRMSYERYEHGVIKRQIHETEEDPTWTTGAQVIFPNAQVHGDGVSRSSISFHVPIDDTSTLSIGLQATRPGVPVPPQQSIPCHIVFRSTLVDENGAFRVENTDGQDEMAFCTQGVITDRSLEHLGKSDIGVLLYRQMLLENWERLQEGQDPLNVYRDPTTAPVIQLFDGRSGDALRELENQLRQRPSGTSDQSETTLRLLREAAAHGTSGGRNADKQASLPLPANSDDRRDVTIYAGDPPARHLWRDPL